MNTSVVGASILNIITESLYDKPIVIFREYVQNSVDSFSSISDDKNLYNHIWINNNDLYFLDNGTGIPANEFVTKMESIAFSSKEKNTNIGYKGIGRLSGISYCKKLRFINIVDYKNSKYQEYTIDCIEYNNIQKTNTYNELRFNELMDKIGSYSDTATVDTIDDIVEKHQSIFETRNTGFLVILEDISNVLINTIKDNDFETELSWLLPVPFDDELLVDEQVGLLFSNLSAEKAFENSNCIPAKSYNIYYNNRQIIRPLKANMLRTYVCKSNLDKYAVCTTSFSNEKIEIDKKNSFSGIRIYVDNMLLCDENELIPILQQYGYTNHGLYELIQTVRGIGMMIYIVDKVNLSANARRTFIELTDQDALSFLELLSIFVEDIYNARYALSYYNRAIKKSENANDDINAKKEKALECLNKLAREEITIELIEQDEPKEFDQLSIVEQKRIVKSKISKQVNESLKDYLEHTTTLSLETCIDDFKTWYLAN